MECIQSLSEDWTFDEMILRLEKFEPNRYDKELDASITVGFYEGDRAELRKAVEQVDSDWVEYCGQTLKIGEPGCVGTLPDYRDRGIGLMMVKKATQILKDEGYDYSYIHYTYVAQWYAKLGYETVLQWTKNGIL